jgi:hypothetical protein
MAYRGHGDALGRARERLAAAKERLDVARALVEEVSDALAQALRKIELGRMVAGAAAATVRHAEAMLAATRVRDAPGDEAEAALHAGSAAAAQHRLAQAHTEIARSERAATEARTRLKQARRELAAADRGHDEAARELARLSLEEPGT